MNLRSSWGDSGDLGRESGDQVRDTKLGDLGRAFGVILFDGESEREKNSLIAEKLI